MGGGVRSSARLSGVAARTEQPVAARSAPVDAAARAAAAARRARAAERAREVEDSPHVLREKCRRLARAVKEAKHLVVYTGAGISTAADIPDYRGPHGVWTRLQRGETVGRVEVARAQPTFTHMALTALWTSGVLKFVVSQNCDGLHLRAGLPRRALAELHGDMFAEQCAACRRVYLRTFDTTERTARHAHGTRRLCHSCGRELRDTIVHFGERGRAAWPLNWAGALRHAAAADVVLCLGSSLKVLRRYPRLWRMQRAPNARPALYIVNLQWTPKDAVAALKINARCDTVMAAVARRLRLRVPRYSPRRDPLLAHGVPLAPLETHTSRRAPLSPPASPAPDADSDSDACYSLHTSSSCSSLSPSPSPFASEAEAEAEGEESDDSLPLGRLAERLRASRPPERDPDSEPLQSLARKSFLADRFRSFQVSMRSCEATILLRAEHAPHDPPPPEPPPPAHTPKYASQFDVISPSRFTVADIPSPRSLTYCTTSAASSLDTYLEMHTSGLVTSSAPAPRAVTGELRRFRMQRLAGPTFAPTPASAPAHLSNGTNRAAPSPCSPDRNFNTVATLTTTVKEEEDVKSFANGGWPGGSKLRQLLEIKPFDEDEKKGFHLHGRLELGSRLGAWGATGGAAGADGGDRKCKVQLPTEHRSDYGDIKSEPGTFSGSVPYAATSTGSECAERERERERQREEMGAAEAEAAAFIRRAVLVCRASLYPGLHTIVGARGGRGGRGARTCAWCARRYGSRRCLWYGAPPDAGALRTARRVRGRRYLCACCPDRSRSPHAPHAPHAPLPDDAGWYGKGYRKGRRRRR